MINPQANTLRRRAIELHSAGKREAQHDIDCRALFSFYAAECGLKAAYMKRNNLKNSQEERGGCRSALSFGHRLDELISALQVPASVLGMVPERVLKTTKASITVMRLHEAWRYGEKIEKTADIADWLDKITDWTRLNA